MPAGELTRDQVVPLLDTDDPDLQQTVLDVISRHEGWSSEILALVREWLQAAELPSAKQESLTGALLALSGDGTIQQLVTETLTRAGTPLENRRLLLRVVSRSRLDPLPRAWLEALAGILRENEPRLVRDAIAALRARNLTGFDGQLAELSLRSDAPLETRIAALECLGPRQKKIDAAAFALLTAQLGEQADPLLRVSAARALGSFRPDDQQLLELAPHLAGSGPLTLPLLAPAFSDSSSTQVGHAFLDALLRSEGTVSLSGDELRTLLKSYSEQVQQIARPLFERLAEREREQEAYLTALVDRTLRTPGNPDRGRQVFFSQKVGCYGCHRLEGKGGAVGPDLSLVGRFRDPRALLEAIVFPSSTIIPDYRSYVLATKDGKSTTGMIVSQTADALYLRTSQLAEIRVRRADIEELAPSNVSIMPQGLEKTMTDQEFADLLEFLFQRR
jgi:putative heme-binding domain-containing protein